MQITQRQAMFKSSDCLSTPPLNQPVYVKGGKKTQHTRAAAANICFFSSFACSALLGNIVACRCIVQCGATPDKGFPCRDYTELLFTDKSLTKLSETLLCPSFQAQKAWDLMDGAGFLGGDILTGLQTPKTTYTHLPANRKPTR